MNVLYYIHPFIYWRTSDCFQILAFMNKVAINICVLVSVNFQLLWVNTKGCDCGSYGKSMFGLVRNCQTVFQSVCTIFLTLPAVYKSSCCFTSLPAFGVVSVPDFGHFDRCVFISHFHFNLHFLDDMRGASFHMFICILYLSFGEISVESLACFIIQLCASLLFSLRVFGIFWIAVLDQMYPLQIFISVCVISLSCHSLLQSRSF